MQADNLVVVGTVAGAVSAVIAIAAVLMGLGKFIGGIGTLRQNIKKFDDQIEALSESVARLSERIDIINNQIQREALSKLPSAEKIDELIAALRERQGGERSKGQGGSGA